LVRAQQQREVLRVGFISAAASSSEMAGPEPVAPTLRAFVRGLRALGYVEGKNLIIERRTAESRFERVGGIVTELLRANVDVIVAVGKGTAAAAKQATTAAPIVVVTSTDDPVAEGLVQSLARPGGNVTGFTTSVGPEIEAKRLQLLRETLPAASRIAYLASLENKDWELPRAKSVRTAAQSMNITLLLAEHTLGQYTEAFARMSSARTQALFVSPSPAALADRALIADLAIRNRLPSSFPYLEQVEAGGLMSYGVNLGDVLRRAAGYVDKIFKGTKPSDLPIEQPAIFELVINHKTAKALGIAIPQSILARADRVIE
jgi:putative ABC transport system substrate-binding protein